METPRALPKTGVLTLICAGLTLIVARLNNVTAIYVGLVLFWAGVLWMGVVFGWYPFIRAKKWPICLILVLLLGSFWYLPNLRSHPPREANKELPGEANIFLYERYGGEWNRSQGLQIELDNTVLRNQFIAGKAYRLTPGVTHDIRRTTLTGVKLYLKLPEKISIQPVELWQHTETRFGFKEYSYSLLPPITNGEGQNVAESLFLIFPQPDEYRLSCTITGDGFNSIDRSFVIKLD